jgi:predicted glycosyltransferase involved in capsule biosynthesis
MLLQTVPQPILSVIVPFRNDRALPYLMDRLESQCETFPKDARIELIVVNSGSDKNSSERCRAICEKHGVRYVYHDSEGQIFSIGAARDYGATRALGKAVTFFDIDWRAPENFWGRLLEFMAVYGISRRKKAFFTVPALYLTQEGTEEFLSRHDEARYVDFHLRWLRGDTYAIQNMAPCSSIVVLDRLHYLSIGGHRPEFKGHGFEDFELYHRLIGEEGILPRPAEYYKDAKNWDGAAYNGFRTQFSLLGRPALLANLFVVHLWHPRPQAASFYNPAAMQANRDAWVDIFREYDKTKEHPDPLIDASVQQNNVLFFGQPRTNLSRCLRDIFPIIGTPKYVDERDLIDKEGELLEADLAEMLRCLEVRTILFNAPYGNPARLKIYEWCRRTNFPYLVFERGALPDSWFLDSRGFNADSASYDRNIWDRPLSSAEMDKAVCYVRNYVSGSDSLERQGQRIGGAALGAKLKVGGKKVLFVPLQRPSDTVIKYMAGPAESLDCFVRMIDDAAKRLKRAGWTVLCKKHPLETSTPDLQHARYVPDDTHFLDLVELADAVALINSGVGVYAMMMGKPCYIVGKAFYAFDGINVTLSSCSADELCCRLLDTYEVDKTLMYRFIYYLVNNFYSFGRAAISSRQEADGSLRNLTTSVDFYEIQIPGRPRLCYEATSTATIPMSAPLFERYRLDIWQKAQAKAAAERKPVDAGAVQLQTVVKPSQPQVAVQPIRQQSAAVPAQPPRTAALVLIQQVAGAVKKPSRKLRKLRRDPGAFFADSRFRFLRPMRHLFG